MVSRNSNNDVQHNDVQHSVFSDLSNTATEANNFAGSFTPTAVPPSEEIVSPQSTDDQGRASTSLLFGDVSQKSLEQLFGPAPQRRPLEQSSVLPDLSNEEIVSPQSTNDQGHASPSLLFGDVPQRVALEQLFGPAPQRRPLEQPPVLPDLSNEEIVSPQSTNDQDRAKSEPSIR
jgi:hypothetical protein